MPTVTHKILSLLGSLIGISVACSCAAYGAPAYGVPPAPQAEYKLSGTVVDAKTQAPVAGIAIEFQYFRVLSATDGTWSVDARFVPCTTCSLSVKDTDGALNGAYGDATVPLAPTLVQQPSSALDLGIYEQKNIRITLDAKP